jgi:hypothetical protein
LYTQSKSGSKHNGLHPKPRKCNLREKTENIETYNSMEMVMPILVLMEFAMEKEMIGDEGLVLMVVMVV